MENNKNKPDFFMQWSEDSLRTTHEINCEPRVSESVSPIVGKLRNGMVLLETDTAVVAVNEIQFSQPTSLTFMPNRIGFSLLVASTTEIKYGYGNNINRSPGSSAILLMLPGREIQSTMTPGTMRTVTCSFNIHYAERIVGPLEAISQARLLDALDIRSSLVTSIMFRLMNEAIYPSAISNQVVAALGQALLVECAYWLSVDKEPVNKSKQLTAQDFELIEQHLAGESGSNTIVAELAALCGFSERYFSKLFRQQTGCSISQYIKSVKIARAKAYLLETELSLKEIAYRLGYSTPASFTYSFRMATGTTPAIFRSSGYV